MENSLIVKDVAKIYRQDSMEVHALRGISFELSAGSFVSICGPSGSGKTTLLNLIGGLDKMSAGEILIGANKVSELDDSALSLLRLHHLGFIFQAYNLIPVLTALENVCFVMELQGVSAKERREKGRQILADVGLAGLENRRPAELSGGQQQRVAVARAIVAGPSLVLADEPTANLDSETARALLELMRELNETRRVTFLFSTHDQLVMSYAQRLIRLHDGLIESDELRD